MGSESKNGQRVSEPGHSAQQYLYPLPVSYEEKPIELGKYLGVVSRQRWLFATIVAMFVLGAILLALLLPRTYQAKALIAAVEEDAEPAGFSVLANQFGGLSSLAGLNLSIGGNKEQAVAILQSRNFTENFIESQNLLPILYSDSWDSEAGGWSVDSGEKAPTLWQAVKLFDADVRNVTVRKSDGLVEVAVNWKDPVVAAEWANLLVVRVNQLMREEAIKEATKSIGFLEKQLQETSAVELQQGIYRLIEKNLHTIMLANVRDEYAFKVLDPAAPPDMDDFVSPKRLLIVLTGVFFGMVLAIVLSFVRDQRAHSQD